MRLGELVEGNLGGAGVPKESSRGAGVPGLSLLAPTGALLLLVGGGLFALIWVHGPLASATVWSWVLLILIGALASLPVVGFIRAKDRRDLFHPMLFLSATAILPMVLIKGLWVLVTGQYSLGLSLTADPSRFLALALLYSLVGYTSLFVGFYSPMGRSLGTRLSRPTSLGARVARPALGAAFFAIGVGLTIWLASAGAFGYGAYNGDLTYLNVLQEFAILRDFGLFILAFSWASPERPGGVGWLLLVALPIELAIDLASGSRGQLLATSFVFLAAAQYGSSRSLKVRHLFGAGVVALVAIGVAVLVGTNFRAQVKYSSGPVPLGQVPRLVSGSAQTVRGLGGSGTSSFLQKVVFERLESLDDLSLTLAYSRQLASSERSLGLFHNIPVQMTAPFIPRALWPSKPAISDFGIDFNRLYYGQPESQNHRGPTVIGDLYRNYGVTGVIGGMFLLGLALRLIYSWLIETRAVTVSSSLLFFFVISNVALGNFFGVTFSSIMYTLFVFWLVGLAVKHMGHPEGRLPFEGL